MRPTSVQSPNYRRVAIPVEFVVLHYTAGDLQTTLRHFADPNVQVSAHLVIDANGTTYEMVPCWEGTVYQAWHAGKSQWLCGERIFSGFNDFSIGIELVNLNGNIFPYTDNQYEALFVVMRHLMAHYPALTDPYRIIGHEQIAGFRGKTDPGVFFDWHRLWNACYPDRPTPLRVPVCPEPLQAALSRFKTCAQEADATLWHAVSRLTETAITLLQGK